MSSFIECRCRPLHCTAEQNMKRGIFRTGEVGGGCGSSRFSRLRTLPMNTLQYIHDPAEATDTNQYTPQDSTRGPNTRAAAIFCRLAIDVHTVVWTRRRCWISCRYDASKILHNEYLKCGRHSRCTYLHRPPAVQQTGALCVAVQQVVYITSM